MGSRIELRAEWFNALAQMKHALTLLDEADAPADIGAHLDLAIARLETLMSSEPEALRKLSADILIVPPTSIDH